MAIRNKKKGLRLGDLIMAIIAIVIVIAIIANINKKKTKNAEENKTVIQNEETKAGETAKINCSITADFANAYDFKITKK